MIIFENITKRYPGEGTDAVKNLNLEIKSGTICMFVGPSGCGKTTTMKMINKLIVPSSGKILIDGRDIESVNTIELRLGIGYIIQDIGLFPHMTVGENIAVVPGELGWKKDRISGRIEELLELVELDPRVFRNKKPNELSGGQRQRVGVARALAGDPPVMLMDEPFGALDPISRAKMQDEFLHIQEKIRKTIVFVTHDIEEAIKMGDSIAVMREGHVIQLGTPMEILSHPADPFVSELIGGRNSLKMLNLMRLGHIMKPLRPAEMRSPRDETARDETARDETARGRLGLKATAQDALSEMLRIGERSILVEDGLHNAVGIVDFEDLLKRTSIHGNA